MHTVFAFQITVGIIAFDIYSNGFYASVISLKKLRYGSLVAMSLCPTQIEAHKHLRPVLALSSASSRIYFQHHAELVLLAAEHIAKLKFLDRLNERCVLSIDLLLSYKPFLYEIEGKLKLLHLFFKCGI